MYFSRRGAASTGTLVCPPPDATPMVEPSPLSKIAFAPRAATAACTEPQSNATKTILNLNVLMSISFLKCGTGSSNDEHLVLLQHLAKFRIPAHVLQIRVLAQGVVIGKAL